MDKGSWAVALLESLFQSDTTTALALLGDDSYVDAHRLYPIEGARGVVDLAHAWSRHYPYELKTLRVAAVHTDGSSTAIEARAEMVVEGAILVLPIAVVESFTAGRRHVRIYHSERLLTGVRKRRRPAFDVADDAEPTPLSEVHPVIATYMGALATGNPDKVLACFAPAAVLTNGVRPVVRREELHAIYTMMAKTGGARLVRAHEIDADGAVVFEYTALPRESIDTSPRTAPGGGVAIYKHNENGLITEVAVFDDFDPDALLQAAKSNPRS